MIDTNFKGFLYVTKPVFKYMKKRNERHIVNLVGCRENRISGRQRILRHESGASFIE